MSAANGFHEVIKHKCHDVRKWGDAYKDTGYNLVQLIWAVANYYKHNDTWGSEEWSDEKLDPKQYPKEIRGKIKQARKTRRIVEKVGICRSPSENMRTAYAFFGIDPCSNCEQLADEVQKWAVNVYTMCTKD